MQPGIICVDGLERVEIGKKNNIICRLTANNIYAKILHEISNSYRKNKLNVNPQTNN